MNFSPYEMVGLCASTTSFHHPSILYGGILSPDVRCFFPEHEYCLHAWTLWPFCNNLFPYHFPSFFSLVIKEQPILFVRKWAQWYVRPVFFAMLKTSETFISLLLLPRRWVVLESQADRDKWHGCQFWDLGSCSSYNSAACLHPCPSMQAKFILGKRKDRTSGLSIPSLMQRPGWRTRPYHFVCFFSICAHSFCRLFARAHVL